MEFYSSDTKSSILVSSTSFWASCSPTKPDSFSGAGMGGSSSKEEREKHRKKLGVVAYKSGLPGKPITISGKGAILDAKGFYAPMLDISNQSHIVIDGLTFDNPDIIARKGIITAYKTSNITIRNCRTGIDKPHDWRAGGFLNARLSEYSLIENNIIWGSDYPITYSGKNVTIRQNTIVKSAMMSLIFTDTDNIKIENNILYR
jgi:hypothetical protein